jgi:Zn-dependent oligopeptidase
VEHQKDFANDQLEDTMSEPKDFVEAFLKEMRRRELAKTGHHFKSIF